jgi:hypothetical protein
MHKPPMMIMKSNNNSRHLREIGEDFKEHKINIRAIGGGENSGTGVFAFTIDDDSDDTLKKVKDIAKKRSIELVEWGGITIELPDRPGALADVAGALDDENPPINIGSLLVVGSHADAVILLIGVDGKRRSDAHEALERAGFYVYDDAHGHASAAF